MKRGSVGTECWRGHKFDESNPYQRGGCLICKRENSAKWRKNNAAKSLENYRKSKYGVTPEMFAEMMANQRGCCAICRKTFTSESKSTKPHIDHSHRGSQKVRGLLCHQCNVLIANALDSVLIVQSAATYLTNHAND